MRCMRDDVNILTKRRLPTGFEGAEKPKAPILAGFNLKTSRIWAKIDLHNRNPRLAKRREIIEERAFAIEAVTDAVAIEVLLILIRHPGSKAGDVARRLKGHSPPITMRHVRVVFDKYGLDDVCGKKKPSEP